ncbi:dual specificity protein kinase yak1 [Perkinsus olseni]|uniref:Dual specificity protein kinase yak1 n=2 Tax=Perkinsus olseni TaxID=32597 RepID=A0A7J6UC27_PEROL|nr:dual specificity protein kinase yak1 [Perkinsus olseni]
MPRSAELCLMNLIDDTSSFLHNSSSRPITDGNDSAPSTPYRQGRGGYSPTCGGGGRQRSESIYSNASSPSQAAGPSGLRSFPQHQQQQPVHVGSAPAASFMAQGVAGSGNRPGPVDEGNSNKNNNKGIPLPDDTMPVSYRPALHKVPDSYFQGFIHGKYLMSSGHPLPLGVSPPAHYSRLQHQMQQQQQQHPSNTAHRPFSGPHSTLAPQRTASGHPMPHRSPGGTDGGGGSRTHDMMYAAKGSSSYHNHHHQQQQQLAAGLYGSKATGQSRHGSDAPRGGLQSAQSRGQQQVYQSPSPGVSVHSSGSHGQYGQRQSGLGTSSMLQQASGQGRVHMHIAAHHRRLGGNNRDRVLPFSQHSSCSSDSFDDPAFAGVPSHELSYMPPAGSEWCPLVSGSNTPQQPSAAAGFASYGGPIYPPQEGGIQGINRRNCLDPSPLRSSNPCDVTSPLQQQQQPPGSIPLPADDGTDLGIYIQEQLQHISPARGGSGVEAGVRQNSLEEKQSSSNHPPLGSSHPQHPQRTVRQSGDAPVVSYGKEGGGGGPEGLDHRVLRE